MHQGLPLTLRTWGVKCMYVHPVRTRGVPPLPPLPCRFVYDSPMPLGRLVRQLADKAQIGTQRSWKRPYGVGLMVGGVDESG